MTTFFNMRNEECPMPNVVLPELEVMQIIADAIDELTPAQKVRVAAWLSAYATNEDVSVQDEPDMQDDQPVDPAWEEPVEEEYVPQTFDTFAELFEAVAPKTAMQKVAVAAYWLQNMQDKQVWKASEANKLLKSIDVKISSISIVLTNGIKSKEPLAAMVARNGDSMRSRKTFTLTDAGIAFVENRIA